HIKAQIEAAHWPIFCPMCGPDQANRGELAGGDEEMFKNWNRMELGSVSISLECPRVDAEDFRETDVLDCPLGCGAHWCKNCHREIERNKKHSCDGQEEFDELARDQKWKKCPGCGVMAQKDGGCNQVSCLTPGCNTYVQ
ncbi:12076_t:CDS:2, partial [Acaulospora colombiana]